MSFVRSTAFEGLARSYTAASCSLNCLFFCAKSFHYLCRDLIAYRVKRAHLRTRVNVPRAVTKSPQDGAFRSCHCHLRAGGLLGKEAHCSTLRSVSARVCKG